MGLLSITFAYCFKNICMGPVTQWDGLPHPHLTRSRQENHKAAVYMYVVHIWALTALMSVKLAPAQIKPERLTDFSSEELKEHFSHRLFSISQLFPTYFHQSLPKIAVSNTHKIQCFRNGDSCPFDASKHTCYCIPALSPLF